MRYSAAYDEDIARVLPYIKNVEALFGKTVLITGGTGLICSAVADVLHYLNRTRQANIRILLAGRSEERTAKRFYNMRPGKDYVFVPFDATAPGALDVKPDHVIHGASNANPAAYASAPVQTMEANLLGLDSLLSYCARTKAARGRERP